MLWKYTIRAQTQALMHLLSSTWTTKAMGFTHQLGVVICAKYNNANNFLVKEDVARAFGLQSFTDIFLFRRP